MLPGVFQATNTNGKTYYRASVTYSGRHISLGSYDQEVYANQAYQKACEILQTNSSITIEGYYNSCILPFEKWVVLINFRDNKIYFKNPIYLKKKHFLYYLDLDNYYRFDAEDLFYYAHHKIMKRGGHLFVSDYGMQINILSRYGIKSYGVPGKDYLFMNGDDHDFSYHNIEVINRYHGVTKIYHKGKNLYQAKIHINGDYIIGEYETESEAAIAYNKAALLLNNHGLNKNFPQNFVDGMNEITYASTFQKLRISKKLIAYANRLNSNNSLE